MGQTQTPFRCKLIVWDRVIELCAAVYALTRKFPREEIYGLTSQIRRASVSIPSNIAEGYGRGTREQYKQFLSIALGSYMELRTQLVIASRLGLVDSSDFKKVESLASEVGRMLSAMVTRLRAAAESKL
ncbi:MAG TPA: four helix bundle protein [Acidobacteriaceae bacterium]|nr:four helix bundle protein [Acidobacteriaceae bacterium]